MKKVFKSGEFENFRKLTLNDSRQAICESVNTFGERKTTIFISHNHSDLKDLRDLIGFLEEKFNVLCYIDSRDPSLPKITSGETATKIKERIRQCDKFILLATNRAINSKWCNWELGYGDAQKYKKHIALFSFETEDEDFNGYEYMEIYPHIVRYYGDEKFLDGTYVNPGYYVCTISENRANVITPLEDWLSV